MERGEREVEWVGGWYGVLLAWWKGCMALVSGKGGTGFLVESSRGIAEVKIEFIKMEKMKNKVVTERLWESMVCSMMRDVQNLLMSTGTY